MMIFTIGGTKDSYGPSTATCLKKIILSNNLEEIPSSFLARARNLVELTIPSSVTSIGDYAFESCSSLTSITIPEGVTNISAFYGCSSLIDITIPKSVTNIGNNAFGYCRSLTSITIPNSVTSIGNDAFFYCSSLIDITIPKSVTNIGNGAFYGCGSLTTVNYRGTEEQWNEITIDSNNEYLTNATINYNYTGE